MKREEIPSNPAFISTSSASSLISVDIATKYNDILEISLKKRIRNALFALFNYVSLTSPKFIILHSVVSFWRAAQYFWPALAADSKDVWGESSISYKVLSVLTIFFQIVPVRCRHLIDKSEYQNNPDKVTYLSYGNDPSFLFLLVFSIVFIGFFNFLLFFAFSFEKNARVPTIVSYMIAVFFSTVGYLVPSGVASVSGGLLGRVINNPDDLGSNIGNIFMFLIANTVSIVYQYLQSSIYSASIAFKIDSLPSVTPKTSFLTSVTYLIATLFMGIASQLNSTPRIICMIVSIITYGLTIPSILLNGGYVKVIHTKLLLTTSDTAMATIIAILIIEECGFQVQEYLFLVVILLAVIFYLLNHLIVQKFMNHYLVILDSIDEDGSKIDCIKSAQIGMNMLLTGFRTTHPLCMNFNLPKMLLQKFPTNSELWTIYTKFLSIYPEMNQQLACITIGLLQNKVKGSTAKYIMQKIRVLMRQREMNLVPELKVKLDKINKQVQAAKHKVRYIWDLIIQGNIAEMSGIVDRAAESIKLVEREFQHLLHQYPNSRFVARSYARFLRDVAADHAAHKIWAGNVSILQRGALINEDYSHRLGMIAFPNLPAYLDENMMAAQNTTGLMTDETITQDIEGEEERALIDVELRMSLRVGIDKLRIPSFHRAKIIRLILFIFLFLIPVIVVFIYTPIHLDEIIIPIDFMYYVAKLRNIAFQAMASGVHYILENLHDYDPVHHVQTFPFDKIGGIEDEEPPPLSFGGHYDSKLQTQYFLSQINAMLPNLIPMLNFRKNDKKINEIRDMMFGDSFEYVTVSEPIHRKGWNETATDDNLTFYNVSSSNKSVQAAIMLFTIFYTKLCLLDKIPSDAINQPFFSEPFNNARNITNRLSSILDLIKEFTIFEDDANQRLFQIILIVFCIIAPLLYSISCLVIHYQTTKEELIIYKCLTSLPKNVVSRVVDSMKVLKKGEESEKLSASKLHDDETSKQEDNILKIFSNTSGGMTSGTNTILNLAITTLITVVLHITLTVFICLFLINSADKQKNIAPHIDYIMGTYTFDLASLMLLYLLPAAVHPYTKYHIYNFNKEKLFYVISEWQNRSVANFRAFRYGDNPEHTVLFSAVDKKEDNQLNESCANSIVPKNTHQAYSCFTADLLLYYSQLKVKNYLLEYESLQEVFPGNELYLRHLWHIHQVHIFENYYSIEFEKLIPAVVSMLQDQEPILVVLTIIIVIIGIISEIILALLLQKGEEKLKFALRLLLHCPAEVVIANSHINALLSGNFSEKHLDLMTRDAEFYDVLVKDMPDSVIIVSYEGIITAVNKSTKRIFEIEIDNLVGQNIAVVGEKFAGSNPFLNIAELIETERCYVYDGGERGQIHLEMSVTDLGEGYLISTRDVTQTIMYNMLISDEKAKSDRLLASILPAKLVPRVQAGEKNISFAVQTATIVFMDIVSFTPWCGSIPAATVMKTLNLLFKEYDTLLAVQPSMTKIKCIGDCYMAAGGIFMEINQPSIHAKEVVEFGLDAINSLEELNKRIEQNLQIRVGINTGGPIVAGVLGTEKPTFEILGPAINMAQQMEHHGIPMKVHVSRSVYELIYGSNFNVKEKGETLTKNGPVITYIISSNSKK
ncbi:Adenylate and Guanylate cyclase catalytic domain containing protein [Tritrichomonas foetus]|uniref:Adenylate and Guanylate cyclase catalytic domain containing protein n=1 Tax=Tritrichomonas foetus TaxID=1144522 RepID=A0A1J4KUT4_9EUKA|nr:Adenylate and Guanylate cyclase catalytic domain containing protein [Tritrichomonas foetus]|eukprot:OHT15047.1 Adenylate and Guanylate cyclase catalytic domain containing protein [Tritrichomonas foetus]